MPEKPTTRSRATMKALKRMPHEAASPQALAAHAREAAKQRGHADLSRAARKAAATRRRHHA